MAKRATATTIGLSFFLLLGVVHTEGATLLENVEDRSVNYLQGHPSSDSTEPSPVGMILFQGVCDDSAHHENGVPVVGMALFCGIAQESEIKISVDDALMEVPVVSATCIVEEQDGFWWHSTMKEIIEEDTLELPPECAQHPEDPEGTTRVGIRIVWGEATAGQVTLSYERAGPA